MIGRPAWQLLAQVTSTSNRFLDTFAGVVRGRLALAQDRAELALTDATAQTLHATDTGADEDFYYGEALEARCHHAQGSDTEAHAITERFLTRWHNSGGFFARALSNCANSSPSSYGATRTTDIRRAALLLPEACRWRDALLLTADQRYADAAQLYDEIGSHPLAADAHLLAARQASEQGRVAEAALPRGRGARVRRTDRCNAVRGARRSVRRSCVVADNPLWKGGRGSGILS